MPSVVPNLNPTSNKLNIRDVNFSNAHVIMRADYNVPTDDAGNITDPRRIIATIPTCLHILNAGGKLVLMSHKGQPEGKVVASESLRPVAAVLRDHLQRDVKFINDCVGDEVDAEIAKLKSGEVILLENVRFHPEEEMLDDYATLNDFDRERVDTFAAKLASHGSIYVNDAFGAAHRRHVSTAGLSKHIEIRAAGLLMEKEINYLGRALTNPPKPFCVVFGGSKVSDKIKVMDKIFPLASDIIIGGAMAYTFLVAKGIDVGRSLVEMDHIETAKGILDKAARAGIKIHLPSDHLVALDRKATAPEGTSEIITGDFLGLDIGPKTILRYGEVLMQAKTVLWNGPMGRFEEDNFAHGSEGVAKAIIRSKALSIVGGGDSALAVEKFGLAAEFSHVSTGGGASLKFLEGKPLPGVEELSPANN